jgi:hypothetical protein
MCNEVIEVAIPDLPRQTAGEVSKRSRKQSNMLPLLVVRVLKRETGSRFLIVGNSRGQACSCGIVKQDQGGAFTVLPAVTSQFTETLSFLRGEAPAGVFHVALRQVSRHGPPLPIEKQSHVTFEQLLRQVTDGRIPSNVMFVVSKRAG